jgi:hypothetical protein
MAATTAGCLSYRSAGSDNTCNEYCLLYYTAGSMGQSTSNNRNNARQIGKCAVYSAYTYYSNSVLGVSAGAIWCATTASTVKSLQALPLLVVVPLSALPTLPLQLLLQLLLLLLLLLLRQQFCMQTLITTIFHMFTCCTDSIPYDY